MEKISDYIVIAGVCGLVLFILFFRNKIEALLRLLMRGAVGVILIYFVNQVLLSYGINSLVGINPITVLTSVFLGIPGVCALYFIVFL